MKTTITNQKNNLEKLAKVLGIGTLQSLGFKANGQWMHEYTSNDHAINNGNTWFPIHSCFGSSLESDHFSSS